MKDASALHGIILLSKLHILVTLTGKLRPAPALSALLQTTVFALAITLAASSNSLAQTTSDIDAAASPFADTDLQGTIRLFEPPAIPPGRKSASLVVGAIAANFWLDGDGGFSAAAEEFFTQKTDPLRANSDRAFSALIDRVRNKPISMPLFTRIAAAEDENFRLAFAWEEEDVAPPGAITFRTNLDRHCFTLNLPLRWRPLIGARLDIQGEMHLNPRQEVRLEIVGLPTEAFGTAIAEDARQAFGVRCLSHTIVRMAPVVAVLLTVDGSFLSTISLESS